MLNFSPNLRLRQPWEYHACRRKGTSAAGPILRLHIRRGTPSLKLGITVSKRYGKAHKRNRFKRCVREAFRKIQHDLPSDLHLNVAPQGGIHSVATPDIERELLSLLIEPDCECS